MCIGIIYQQNNALIESHFNSPIAKLPVKLRNGNLKFFTWGRRIKEKGNLPIGGWAELGSINAGEWNEYFPKPICVRAEQFAEYNVEMERTWFHIPNGQAILGLQATYQSETRIYIVTITPKSHSAKFKRWPKIVFGESNANFNAK